jgi:hypothetical protein
VTERVLPLADGASACPFVAFEDDRDERATVPDHRHRCYAEPRPAPRALAHQEAYCLSSAFPVCPIFQDWARREAARARADTARTQAAADARGDERSSERPGALSDGAAAGGAGIGASAAAAGLGGAAPADDRGRDDDERGRDGDDDGGRLGEDRERPGDDRERHGDDRSDDPNRRNPPRDWAAPPPWLASRDGRHPDADADPPPFLGRRAAEPGRGLAGSPADRMAGGPPPSDDDDVPWTASAASAAAGRAALGSGPAGLDEGRRGRRPAEAEIEDLDPEDEVEPRRPVRRPRAYDQHLGGTAGPDWERPRRQDAYPTIKARMEFPDLRRLLLMAGLVVVSAIALYFLPAVLGMGSGNGTPGAGSPGPSSAAQRSPSAKPTTPPAPTPSVYTIKKGETLSKIATAHGITIEELLLANPTIKDANKISEGQQIILPVPSEAPPAEFGGSPEASAP